MNNIVFIDVTTNYPTGFTAGNTKMEYMAKGILELGGKTIAINSAQSTSSNNCDYYGKSATGIEYITFNSNVRFKIFRNYFKIYKTLKARKTNGSNSIILSSSAAYNLLVYIIIAKLTRYKTIFLFHEWRISMKTRSLVRNIDAWLKDSVISRLFDAYLPISHFLLEKSNKFSKKKKKLILPILADYSIVPEQIEIKERFSYCCSVRYILLHPIILEAMNIVVEKYKDTELVLVLSGTQKDINDFKENINTQKCKNSVTIKYNISFDELNEIYQSSLGLIIPLDPNATADIARFSQKIAEYIATGRPIITNAVGEVPYYFKDRESAYFSEYSAEGFSDVMIEMIENKEFSNIIGKNGFEVGQSNFDYRINAKKITDFLTEINI